MSTHTIHAALVRSTGPSLGSIVLAALINSLFQLLIIITIFLQKLPFYLRRIPWVPLATPIAIYVIPGVGWVVRLLEGWTSRLNKYGLIYAGLTGEPFWVSAARAGVLIDKGRERTVSVETDGNNRGRVLKKKKGFSSERKLLSVSLFLADMKFLIFFDLYSSTDFIDDFSAYTYSPICLDCLSVCRAYTWGAEFGFGCSNHCRHCYSTCRTVLCGIGQRYVSRGFDFVTSFYLAFLIFVLIVSCSSLDIYFLLPSLLARIYI